MPYPKRSIRGADRLDDGDLSAALERIARAWRGEPTSRRGHELRFGRRGSLSVDLEHGVWFDHEAGVGGGALDLAVHAGLARDRREALVIATGLPAHSARATTGLPMKPAQLATGLSAHAARAAAGLASGRDRSRPDCASGRDRSATDAHAAAAGLWMAAEAVTGGDLAGHYLLARALRPPWPAALRFHPAAWCAEAGRPLPALVAAAMDAAGRLCAVQRTWLVEPGRKAQLTTPRKTLGSLRGAAVHLNQSYSGTAGAVVVAEGVETALSAGRALRLPAVATLGAGNLAAFVPGPAIRRIIIAPDRDPKGVGERAARALAQRLVSEGRSVALAWPPDGAKDWNDWAMAQAAKGEAAHAIR